MARLLGVALALTTCRWAGLAAGPSEYQLDSTVTPCEALRGGAGQRDQRPQCTRDGRFRPVQCSERGQECWCVDGEGQEVAGTRTNGTVGQCATPCHLQSTLRCSPSGHFLPVQCDAAVGQCWCVDQDGVELYGTRQTGTPHECPGSCSALSRRLLHTAVSSSPPQCSGDGDFLPVQCRLVNVTDGRELDLLRAFNAFPEAFSTFRSFGKFFPLVSAYCFCSDGRGREMADTGVELLLSDVYDSAFSGAGVARSLADSTVFKVLRRRTLAVRLAVGGRFRCPSACEDEQRAATATSDVFVPSCEEDGAFSSKQCQQGGQCWCVDPAGAELPGTRQRGDSPVCGGGGDAADDCASLRRASLSRLFSGPLEARLPVGPSAGHSASCRALLRPVEALLPVEADPVSFLSVAADVLHGVFPSAGEASEALAGPSPRRLQESLFGGKFLKNAARFNLSGAVGARSVVRADAAVRRPRHQELVLAVSRALEDRDFQAGLRLALVGAAASASLRQVLTPVLRSCAAGSEDAAKTVFVPSCTPDGSFREVQCRGGECWCVTPRGREVAGTRVADGRPRCPSRCERARAAALGAKDKMAAGAEVHVPACADDGRFLPLQCGPSTCFCVDREGVPTTTPSLGGTVACESGGPDVNPQQPPSPSSGECSRAFQEVTAFRQEVSDTVALSNSSHFPVGYAFLLAEGLRLAPEELPVAQSEEISHLSDRLLSRSKAALRLAAYSTMQMLQPAGRLAYEPFTPQCGNGGEWRPTQCYHNTGQCWCVDEDGDYVPGSLRNRSRPLLRCLTRCERARTHSLLSGWMKASDITSTASGYRPQCDKDGAFSVLQTEGAAGWCVHPVSGERLRNATPGPDGRLTCPSRCELQGLQCRPDGSFVPLQCDVTSCWCVSEDGQEVEATRRLRATGRTPSCDRPAACLPAVVARGALLCRPAQNGRQSCDLVCHRGYHNSLPVGGFTCDTAARRWEGDLRPLPAACQMISPPQRLWASQNWSLAAPCSNPRAIRSQLLHDMTSGGLCSAQLPASRRSVSQCDDSPLHVRCHGDTSLSVTVIWSVFTSDLPTSELPALHDIAAFLDVSRLLERFERLLARRVDAASRPQLVSATGPRLGCSRGYRLSDDGEGCVVCPAGSYSAEGACLLCPEGTYQDTEGRDFCKRCPRGSSPPGAFAFDHCETDCERRGLRCSDAGDFLPAQADFLSGGWRCFTGEGAELKWTTSDTPLTDDDCSVLGRFRAVPRSEVIFGAADTHVLQSLTSDLRTCAQACAMDASCHHVALSGSRCEVYSTHTLNTHCNTSEQVKGFLGNGEAQRFDWLRCFVKVRGGASNVQVIRKIGAESTSEFTRSSMTKAESGVFRTSAFADASLADARRFCELGCRRDDCCHGFVLNRNSLNGGSVLCGWLRAPSVLTCGRRDWDAIGRSPANRTCGAGLSYNKQRRHFLFDFGGQKFSISEAALPASSGDKKDYQASIVDFQAVYLKTAQSDAASCAVAANLTQPLDGSVLKKFASLSEDDVLVDSKKSLPVLSFLLNKKLFTSQNALLWCLTRCDDEPSCSVAELSDANSSDFFNCFLFPDSRACGDYDTPLGRPCRLLLDRKLSNAFSKKVDLGGPVKSFYERVPFKKMVSYSVRNRLTVKSNTPLPDGFMDCERRCDEDACCRGFGFIADSKNGSTQRGAGVACVILISLGIQTCAEDRQSSWTVHDCPPNDVHTAPHPFGWYQKPVNRWTSSPALCPAFTLPTPQNNASVDEWNLLPEASLLLDASSPSYDVIHISRDIAADPVRTRDWCLHACRESESCAAVSLAELPSATRCVLYPDTAVCGLSSAPDSPRPASSCRLVIREPAPQVYLRRGEADVRTSRYISSSPPATNVAVAGHGTLRGVAVETALGTDRKTVVQFLGVPYARPPIGSLRFRDAQPPNWTGTWDATRARSACVQPGRADGSEDCLYLDVFRPVAARGRVPVLVFFVNPSTNRSRAILDGSTLAAVGDIVVVTAGYRTAALGFLCAGSSSGTCGNWGASDQEAALVWVHAHISALGGDKTRVTVGAERGGADIISLRLMHDTPLFRRMLLMGGSLFSPALFQTPAAARRQALTLAAELRCATDDDRRMAACLRAAPVHTLNTAQTKLLAASGPFRSWSPTRRQDAKAPVSLRRVDLLLGTSQEDGIIGRARGVKDFAATLPGGGAKAAFYEALSRSLGGASENPLLKEAATWFYSLDHSSAPAGYNLFSRALDNATRDMFIVCPTRRMARHFANSGANVFAYHQPAPGDRADVSVPLDVQLVFGAPHRPVGSRRFTGAERRLSLAAMTYVANFVAGGDPNPSASWPATALPRWRPVLPSVAPPAFLELSPALIQKPSPADRSCSFWDDLTKTLERHGRPGAEPAFDPELPVDGPDGRSPGGADAYN
ncbi:thyroglobulin isoform X2 [Syngnathoides biaculeatus]|uniref:thyroglobulin isoform X2 n=1 Tax=Syngnathoides biaculeatus TaxID=300417 RepID=UPI002ADD6014|nr:thyroglobulin isoform X2 [Syngnathoides biaculeatus]